MIVINVQEKCICYHFKIFLTKLCVFLKEILYNTAFRYPRYKKVFLGAKYKNKVFRHEKIPKSHKITKKYSKKNPEGFSIKKNIDSILFMKMW